MRMLATQEEGHAQPVSTVLRATETAQASCSCSYREHFTCYGSAITREMLSVTAAVWAVSVAHESETFLQSLRHVMGRN